jgi:hypothetical protein
MKTLATKPRRGAALVTVIIITSLLLLVVGSVLQLSVMERKANLSMSYWLEARQAAEAVAEYGLSQVRTQLASTGQAASYKPGTAGALSLPPASAFATGNVQYSSLELVGGPATQVPSVGSYLYSDSDPGNLMDPLKNTYALRNDYTVLAKAMVVPPGGNLRPITVYLEETLSVRGAQPSQYAIFYYNSDLELFPGATMHVYGPVHSNGNIYVSSQGATLSFHSAVTTAGSVFHAWSNQNSAAWGAGNETLGQGAVNFLAKNGSASSALVNMKQGTGNETWMDSTTGTSNNVTGYSNLAPLLDQMNASYPNQKNREVFRQTSDSLWGGNLLTSDNGVQFYNFTGFDSSQLIDPHTIIEPPANLPTAIENQKFSTQSNLYIRVTVSAPAAGSTAAVTSWEFFTQDPGSSALVALKAPDNMTNGSSTPLLRFSPYKAAKRTVGAKLTSGSNANTYPVSNYTVTSGGTGTASTSYVSSLTDASIWSDHLGNGTNTRPSGNSSAWAANTTDYEVQGGLYDQRRALGVDLVEVDMGMLRTAVSNIASNTLDANSIRNADDSLFKGWNGGVYIEVKDSSASAGTSSQSASVRLNNGQVASGSSLVPSYGANGNGLTLSTNAPVYINGNFNADGTVDTVANSGTYQNLSATVPDDVASNTASLSASVESPVCVAADAITVLSADWKKKVNSTDAVSIKDRGSCSVSRPGTTLDTEVAACFYTGNVATTNTKNSGGAHNFVRFLEGWGNRLAIRGSLMCMFRSKIASQPYSTSYYGAPTRIWGLDKLFSTGKIPPLMPRPLSFRRVSFKVLANQAAYDARKAQLWP